MYVEKCEGQGLNSSTKEKYEAYLTAISVVSCCNIAGHKTSVSVNILSVASCTCTYIYSSEYISCISLLLDKDYIFSCRLNCIVIYAM